MTYADLVLAPEGTKIFHNPRLKTTLFKMGMAGGMPTVWWAIDYETALEEVGEEIEKNDDGSPYSGWELDIPHFCELTKKKDITCFELITFDEEILWE